MGGQPMMVAIPRVESGGSRGEGSFKIDELLNAEAFAHPVDCLESLETNTSWVVLTGKYAYKIKRSVALEFLDMTTLERRRFLCNEELRLNRRLAPDLYLNVVGIVRDADGLHVDGRGEAVEYAVRMRQFDRSQELSSLLVRGDVAADEIGSFAVRLADFHASAARAADAGQFIHTEYMRGAVLGNLAILSSHLHGQAEIPELGALIDWTNEFLDEALPWFRRREQAGWIRECHGDLHARNIVRWRGKLTPFDCLEFDPKLRWIDIVSDIAFLFMDLTARGRQDLAYSFLNRYLEVTGDYDGIRLLRFYAVYRALIRAMVDALAAEQNPSRRDECCRRFEARVRIAAELVRPLPPPALILMHGPSGSGKTSLSERLVGELGAVRIRSDVERKRLAGASAGQLRPAGIELGIYAPQLTARTYAHLRDCAQACLEGGVTTIVDAAFLRRADRNDFLDLAARMAVPCRIVSCAAERAVLAQRVRVRRRAGADPSDADVKVLDHQLRTLEPLTADERAHVTLVDTAAPAALQTVLAALRDARSG